MIWFLIALFLVLSVVTFAPLKRQVIGLRDGWTALAISVGLLGLAELVLALEPSSDALQLRSFMLACVWFVLALCFARFFAKNAREVQAVTADGQSGNATF